MAEPQCFVVLKSGKRMTFRPGTTWEWLSGASSELLRVIENDIVALEAFRENVESVGYETPRYS